MLSDSEEIVINSEQSFGQNFSHLRPVFEQKPQKVKRVAGSLTWMKANDKENKKGKKQQSKTAKQQERTRKDSRSRSRSREKDPRRRPTNITMREFNRQAEAREDRQQKEDRECIEISDDEQIVEMGQGFQIIGGRYYLQEGSYESLNWRQRRYLDRLFAREERKYWQGKQRDELSFKVFNTIEQYFR